MLEIGSVVDGKYKILNKIGQGGMSIVYLAMNEKANKQWAIKEVRKDGVQDNVVFQQGLVAETEILKNLNHKCLPSIVDIIESDDRFLIVMDYIEGNSLNTLLEEAGAQPQEKVIAWGKELCDVLGYLHHCNPPIIYRDMKPSNIMLKPDGTLTLIDFGAAREYKQHRKEDTISLGTEGYAAPEQFGGKGQTDARTDIYTLGATLYHLVTNRYPCQPPDYVIGPITEVDPSLSPGLEEIILKCTRRDPRERYQSCDELYYALEHYDEQDIKYKKAQKVKLGIFIFFLLATIAGGITTAYGHAMEMQVRGQTYESYVVDAVTKTTADEILDTYRDAISLAPEREEAYMAMLNTMLEDGYLDEGEDKYLRSVLAAVSENGSTNEANFETNRQGYSDFAYELGKAYWYNYRLIDSETGTYKEQREHNLAARWFERVVDSDEAKGKEKYANAQVYAKMGGYYSRLGVIDKAGDAEVNYSTYLFDLMELYQGQESNTVTRLYLNKEIIYQIATCANYYAAEGVERELLEQTMEAIEEEVKNAASDAMNQEIFAEQLEKIVQYADTAKKSIVSAYGAVGGKYPARD